MATKRGGTKRAVDAKADDKGNITSVRFRGNSTYTPKDRAIRMTERGEVEGLHVVRRGGKKHLRSNPDNRKKNNLDYMAGVR